MLYGPDSLQKIKTAVTPLKYSKISILTVANPEKKVLSSREEQGLKEIKKKVYIIFQFTTVLYYRAFSNDITAALLVLQNKERAATLVLQTNPVEVRLFCSSTMTVPT